MPVPTPSTYHNPVSYFEGVTWPPNFTFMPLLNARLAADPFGMVYVFFPSNSLSMSIAVFSNISNI